MYFITINDSVLKYLEDVIKQKTISVQLLRQCLYCTSFEYDSRLIYVNITTWRVKYYFENCDLYGFAVKH